MSSVLHVISYILSLFHSFTLSLCHSFTLSPVRTPKASHRGAPLLKREITSRSRKQVNSDVIEWRTFFLYLCNCFKSLWIKKRHNITMAFEKTLCIVHTGQIFYANCIKYTFTSFHTNSYMINIFINYDCKHVGCMF